MIGNEEFKCVETAYISSSLWNYINGDIRKEYDRSIKLHGTPEMSLFAWYAVLAEEVGEVAEALQVDNYLHLRDELTQVATMAIKMLTMLEVKCVEEEEVIRDCVPEKKCCANWQEGDK